MKITTNLTACGIDEINSETEGAILSDGSILVFDSDTDSLNFVIFSTDGEIDIRAGLIEFWRYKSGSIPVSEFNEILFTEKIPMIEKLLTNLEIEIRV